MVKTIHCKQVLNYDYATSMYFYIRDNIQWEDRVRSVKGFTRKAKAINIGDDECVTSIILEI